jgi:plasmid segregation protein ParM
MAKATEENLLVATDDGYAQTKVYGQGVDGKAPVRQVFRTAARSGRHAIRGMQNEGALGLYKVEEGEDFTVNESVQAESTTFDGYHYSTMNRAVVHHGLISAGYDGRNVDLITGLPVADYFAPGGINIAKIEQKKANLLKGIERQGGSTAHIRSVDVGCQAVAAFFDYAFDDALKVRQELKGRVAVVDIGGRTTDIAVIVNGMGIDEANSGSANQGALDVYKALNAALNQKHGLREDFPVGDLAEAVRTGQFEMWGESQDVRELVTAAVRQVEANIAREIDRRIGGVMAGLRKVIFVGGGSALFRELPGRFKAGYVGEDPEFANARGLYKFAAVRQQRTGKAA